MANAALYAPAPARRPGTRGRPRVRGGRLPGPADMLAGRCRRHAFDAFGLRGSYRLASCLACLYDAPRRRRLNVVASEPLTRSGRPAAAGRRAVVVSTVTAAAADQVLLWYAMRWSIEVAFRDAKGHLGLGHLGLEHLYGWSGPAARRTAPTLMLLAGLVVLWAAARPEGATRATVGGTLGDLREATVRAAILRDPAAGRVAEKPARSLPALLRLAV